MAESSVMKDTVPASLREEIKVLKEGGTFSAARKVLEREQAEYDKGSSGYLWTQQQLALCTYKDTQLRPDYRFETALEILKAIGLHEPATKDRETLGLGGAVYKRMWEHDGNEAHLRAALELYRAGWERDPENDRGYCGVNAAYLLDLSAWLAERTAKRVGRDTKIAERYLAEAQQLRREMSALLEGPAPSDDAEDRYWHYATLAEIHFGLGDYPRTRDLLIEAGKQEVGQWLFDSTAQQLLALARWRRLRLEAPVEKLSEEALQCREALAVLLGENLDAALCRLRGKVGLALSGGGFRAAFFHLGVLARLAEIDALRHVEVLSTVSGGSVVGVHYYLELKRVLESVADGDITREDYIRIVRRVQRRFLKGVQKNLRMRILGNLKEGWRMAVEPGYTRSHRIGELYEKELYARVQDGTETGAPRTLPSLLVCPQGVERAEDFKPRARNWLRRAKVPELVVNTTSLNSGHNFQFTASWMGEPPGLTGAEVDMNLRHRRLYYREAPRKDLREFRLGYAVAGSSCVPGLFDPLEIDGLYPGRTVRLVDGGVHDNQGVAGLLDEGCDFILCSDASGQMHDQVSPSAGFIGVPLRSNEILQDRIRECEYDHLRAMSLSGRLKGLFFIHLKKDLAQEDITWIDGEEKTPPPQPNQTPYGIDRDIQRRLSEIRTDLDAFSDVEACALMLSGYRMAEEQSKALNREFRAAGGTDSWGGFDVEAPRGRWRFLRLAPIAAKPCDSSDMRRKDLEKQLKVGRERLFKAWRLSRRLRIAGWGVLALLVAAVAAIFWLLWDVRLKIGWLVTAAAVFLLVLALPKRLLGCSVSKFFLKGGPICGGWVVAKVHLMVFDRCFLKRGRLARLLRLSGK